MLKLKYIFAVFLAAALTSTAVFGKTDLPFSTDRYREVETMDISGNGTERDPYIAKTYDQIKWAFDMGGYVKLGSDISADGFVYVNAEEVHLDLAGFTYTVGAEKSAAFIIKQTNALYITDSGANGKISANGSGIAAGVSAKLYIHGGSIVTAGTAVLASFGAKIYLYDGIVESQNTAVYLNGAWLFQYGGYIKTTSSSLESAVAFDSYYDSGNGVTTNARNDIYLYGGKIDKLYLPFKEANISAGIYDTAVYGCFGYQVKTDAEEMFQGGYAEVCSRNLVNAINAATAGSYKEVTVNDTVTVHQKKTVIPYIEIPNDITPAADGALVYPKANSGAAYSFDSDWYNANGQKLSSTYSTESEHLGAYSFTVKGKAKVKSSSYMFIGQEIYLPNVDSRLYECGVTLPDDSTAEYQIKFGMVPFVTLQPKDKANITIGDILTFSTNASDAKTYKWYLLDPEGKKVSWEDAEEYGIISVQDSSQNTKMLKIKILGVEANAFGVYCEIYGNYNTVNTNTAYISTKKPVITMQPTGIGGIFNIGAKNAQSYEWVLLDENGDEYTWEQAKANGWGYPVEGSENTSSVLLLSIGHGLEGKKVRCKVSGYGYTLVSDTAAIGKFIEIGAHLNIDGLQLPFPGVEFITSGKCRENNAYELESLKLVYGKDLTEVNDGYIDFDGEHQYFYHAVFKPKRGYCFTEDSIAGKYNINGYIATVNDGETERPKYTGTINRQLIDGKVSVLLVPALDSALYRNTKAMYVTATQNSVIVKNYYEKSVAGRQALAELGAPTYKYSLDGINWYGFAEINGGGGPFGNLTPNTEYTLYFKNADTDYIFKTMAVKTLPLLGDVDQNGKVEKADAALLLEYIAGEKTDKLTDSQKNAANVYADNNIDILDAVAIMQMM